MFEEYLQDASAFIEIAQDLTDKPDKRFARRYYRASAFCLAGAIESFVNYVADSFAQAEKLPVHEIAFLNDKKFSPEKGELVQKPEFHRLEDKLKILLKRFVPHFDFQSGMWLWFMELKDLRDSLIHPRQMEDEMTLTQYHTKLDRGMSGLLDLMDCLSKAIFKKHLRKQILDLKPDVS
ncbi:MAG: hypothetical protein ABSH38_18525 [Verrucomicrobiota bacterium]|jgi:hypothetical protein